MQMQILSGLVCSSLTFRFVDEQESDCLDDLVVHLLDNFSNKAVLAEFLALFVINQTEDK